MLPSPTSRGTVARAIASAPPMMKAGILTNVAFRESRRLGVSSMSSPEICFSTVRRTIGWSYRSQRGAPDTSCSTYETTHLNVMPKPGPSRSFRVPRSTHDPPSDAQPLRQPDRLQAALAGSLRPSASAGRLRRTLGSATWTSKRHHNGALSATLLSHVSSDLAVWSNAPEQSTFRPKQRCSVFRLNGATGTKESWQLAVTAARKFSQKWLFAPSG